MPPRDFFAGGIRRFSARNRDDQSRPFHARRPGRRRSRRLRGTRRVRRPPCRPLRRTVTTRRQVCPPAGARAPPRARRQSRPLNGETRIPRPASTAPSPIWSTRSQARRRSSRSSCICALSITNRKLATNYALCHTVRTAQKYRYNPVWYYARKREENNMNNLTPEYIVHMGASRCDGKRSTKTGRRLPRPVTGILFSKDNRSFIIGAAAKQYDPDGIRIDTIMGIEHTRARPGKSWKSTFRNMLSRSMAETFDAGPICRALGIENHNWSLLAAQVCDGERPGRMEPGKGFVAASPLRFPSQTSFGIEDETIRNDTAFRVFGLRSTGTVTETVCVPAKLARTNTTGTAFVLRSDKIDGVEFGGAPILDKTGQLVAMGLFSGTHTSGASAVIAISLRELIDRYWLIVEGVL